MSVKVAKIYFTRKIKDFDNFSKMPKMWAVWVKIIVATGFEKLPKGNKLPNLITLNEVEVSKLGT